MDFQSLFDSVMDVKKIAQDDRAYSSEEELLTELTTVVFSRILLKLKDKSEEEIRDYEKLMRGRIPVLLSDEEEIAHWKSYINTRMEATREEGRKNKLLSLLDKTAASGFDADLLTFLINCRFDSRYMDAAKNALSTKTEPDVLSLYGLFSDEIGRRYFDMEDCSALKLIFPELPEDGNILKEHICCDDRLLALATGKKAPEPSGINTLDPEGVRELLFRDAELKLSLKTINDPDAPLLVLYGAEGSGKRLLSFHAALSLGKKLTVCVINDMINTDSGMDAALKTVRYALRESMVNDSILLIRGLRHDDAALDSFRTLLDCIKGMRERITGIIVAVDTEEEPHTPGYAVQCFMKSYTPSERLSFWKESLDVSGNDCEEVLAQTAGEFELTPGQITEAARRYSRMEDNDSREQSVFRKKLHQACYAVIGHELAKKAKLIDATFTWDELKLPSKDKKLLRDICNAVELRSLIMQDWNFKSRLPYGSGITVLFSGPPGTGKTMAAEVLANELKMELYKIDMSRIIDKYVGETEKHIREIFDLAKKGNFILFFDEADAIFNKRMDAKDANERFANIESSMLLQCIEEYDGVAILATNKMSAMDPAFMRRFRFFIQFTEPDEQIAYSIWKSVFPPEAPLDDDVDFRELAHVFTYTGAIIKNVALQAAYMAAGDKSSITTLHILKAVKREMEKNQRVMTREELGTLSYLYDELMTEREK